MSENEASSVTAEVAAPRAATAVVRLDVVAVFNQAWRQVFRARAPLLRALIVPSVVLAVIARVGVSSGAWMALGGGVLLWLLSMLLWTMFAVSCHRILLAGPASGAGAFGLAPLGAVLHYFGYTIIMVLSAGLALAGAGLAAAVLFEAPAQAPAEVVRMFGMATFGIQLATLVLLAYVSARFVLILPAKALGVDAILEDAWAWSNGNGWRLLLAILMVVFSAILVLLPLVWLLGDVEHAAVTMPLAVIVNLASAVGVAAISCSYLALAPHVSAAPEDLATFAPQPSSGPASPSGAQVRPAP